MLEALMIAQIMYANNLDAAQDASLRAFLKQSGVQSRMDERADQIKKLYIPNYVEKYVANILPLVDTIANKRIVVKYEF